MHFLRLNYFLKLMNDYWKNKITGVTRGSLFARRVMLMSPGGSSLLTSAVGPADVSVDLVNTGHRVIGGVHGLAGPTGQSHCEANRWGPCVRSVQRKRKKRKGYNVPRLNGRKGDQGRTLILASWAEFGPIHSALFSLSLSLTHKRRCRPGTDRQDPPVGLSKGSGVAGSIPSGSVSCGHACVCPALVRR